jgi:mRNA interferase HigB
MLPFVREELQIPLPHVGSLGSRSAECYNLKQMRVIKRLALEDFWKISPAAQAPLTQWYSRTRKARWQSFADVKATFGQTDLVTVSSGRKVAVFDIGGNKFRLIAAVHYNTGKIFVLRVLTHQQYSKHVWKEQL